MNPTQMTTQGSLLGELLATLGTFEFFLSSVNYLVNTQAS